MNLTPLGNRVIVKQDEAVKETDFGLVLIEGKEEKPLKGVIVAVGTGERTVGEHIIFSRYCTDKVDDQHLIVNEDGIIGLYD